MLYPCSPLGQKRGPEKAHKGTHLNNTNSNFVLLRCVPFRPSFRPRLCTPFPLLGLGSFLVPSREKAKIVSLLHNALPNKRDAIPEQRCKRIMKSAEHVVY